MQDLEREIRKHQALYDRGRPEISDAEFDALTAALAAVQPASETLSEMGSAVTETKATHARPMLSLEKAYSDAELETWQSKRGSSWLVEPKLDGISVALRYDGRGYLSSAVTRGDGEVGDVITHNVKVLMSVPRRILLRSSFTVTGFWKMLRRKNIFWRNSFL